MNRIKHSFYFALGTLCLMQSHACYAQPMAAPNVYMLTLSIMSYSSWPNTTATNLCVIDNPSALIALQNQVKLLNYHYKVQGLTTAQLAKANCQAIFFTTTSPQQQQALIASHPRKDILSFSTANIDCEIGSTFCFYNKKSGLSFKINLDALSQAKVRIDPRVLLLAKNAEKAN